MINKIIKSRELNSSKGVTAEIDMDEERGIKNLYEYIYANIFKEKKITFKQITFLRKVLSVIVFIGNQVFTT